MAKDPRELQNKIGYIFKDKRLLGTALSHSSYTNENAMPRLESNERLEFLGDAVLELVSSELLFGRYADMPEGDLTKLRASLVCEPTLAADARAIGLNEYLLIGKGEELTGGRGRDSIISDALEALIGAIYLDGGMDAAKSFILKFILDDIEKKRLFHDSKTALQELIQSRGEGTPVYEITDESGPDHMKCFTARVTANDRVLGSGKGRSKKAAEQQAAYSALVRLTDSGK